MPLEITIALHGDEIVSRKLLRFADRAMNMAPAWDDVTKVMEQSFERNFNQQGPGWPRLQPSTIRSRIAQGYAPGPILTRSGTYRRAMTKNLMTHKSPHELIVLAPRVPGAFHQHGTGRMPRRAMKLVEHEKRNILKIIQRTLIEGYSQ